MRDGAEIWKAVPSYPGLMASSLGRVLMPKRTYRMPHGGMRSTYPRPIVGSIRTATRHATCQYRGITTREWGNIKIHRAVCEAFHGCAPSPRHVVLHLNEDGLDNRPDNLRWGTRKENQNAPGFKAWAASVCREKMSGRSGMRKHRQ